MPKHHRKNIIIESDQINSMLQFIEYDTAFILFDLDNTVIWPGAYSGSDDWFHQLFSYLGQYEGDQKSLVTLAVAIYNEVQRKCSAETVEKNVVKLINSLQSIGYPVIAITARGDSNDERELTQQATLRQLDSLGLCFDDVIFCSGEDKGKMLFQWMTDNPVFPSLNKIKTGDNQGKTYLLTEAHRKQNLFSKVIMADDKEKHLHSVEKTLKNLLFTFSGVRYSKMDGFFGEKNNLDNVHQTLKSFEHFSDTTREAIKPMLAQYESEHNMSSAASVS